MDEFLNDYDFFLPESQIAKYPAENRDESRLLVLNREKDTISEHSQFKEIEDYLKEGDVLVYNETKVSKRRVYLSTESGRIHESVFLETRDYHSKEWICILKNRKKLRLGDILFPEGYKEILFRYQGDSEDLSILVSENSIYDSDFSQWGNIPIPPYLKRKAEKSDEDRYQTIFAANPGSVAAPTAGLHFSLELRKNLESKGIVFVPIILQIGYGTFQPLQQEQFQLKKLHKESYELSEISAKILNQAVAEKRRVISIGTTTLRVLESVFDFKSQIYKAEKGETDIFLSPGDQIHSSQGLITNFHLPKSSLLLLVNCFGGNNLVMRSYHYALERNFRFYSYGDAMFLF
ncbi:tRNA preQ1(34) S-adenosylmethionine ribosyltransferase-isomerase QueA [Leptospira ilyithenensis]|uniref:S-adenosylmethionine:tRNA ribosyltransferase-isomerase n=1 Tax=Leptospira ilyithenensis TaxID=2484901 RepID=A0A4R9LXV5_9LEPT|nr:tRNA preQ1(34) S-adenosylmethionine ribosyltransferase-isomerase QueA [Leptospira ilyithenensis]TGN14591.1 tRNA preQ1(34) S-adenosylmethionine ribosyltransferase-isomerase QueA [Leptospira ilyithenensis]